MRHLPGGVPGNVVSLEKMIISILRPAVGISIRFVSGGSYRREFQRLVLGVDVGVQRLDFFVAVKRVLKKDSK